MKEPRSKNSIFTRMGLTRVGIIGLAATLALSGCARSDAEGKHARFTITSSSPPANCSDITKEEAKDEAEEQLPPSRRYPWAYDFAPGGNFDACLPLSWIAITVDRATVSSPYHILLYHYGEYVGTATEEPQGFFPLIERVSDSAIDITYQYNRGNEPNAKVTGRTHYHVHWDENQQRMIGEGDTPSSLPSSR